MPIEQARDTGEERGGETVFAFSSQADVFEHTASELAARIERRTAFISILDAYATALALPSVTRKKLNTIMDNLLAADGPATQEQRRRLVDVLAQLLEAQALLP